MTLKIIVPTPIVDAMLIASSVAEADAAVWSAATNYGIGDVVMLAAPYHKTYASLQAGNLNHHPETDASSPPFWKAVAPTNQWAMFDQVNSTATTAANTISVSIKPGLAAGLFLGGLVGSQLTVTMTDGVGGEVVFAPAAIELDASIVEDAWDYCFGPFIQKSEAYITDLPMYLDGVITVTLTGGGDVSISTLLAGAVTEMADVRLNAQAGMISFSRKDTDPDTGVTTFVRKGNAKKNNYGLEVPKARVKRVWDALVALDATPCVWIGVDDDDYAMFVLYGFYKDFSITVPYPRHALCDLELEGLT